MGELFFGGSAAWFTTAALIGTAFFLLRMGLMLVGGADAGTDVDVDFHADVGGDLHGDIHGDVAADTDGHHTDPGEAFKLLSVQSIAAFLMGFGWGGLGALKGAGWSLVASITFGLAFGGGMVWLLGKLLALIYGFQSSGNVNIHEALYLEGSVYVSVPAPGEGKGQVRLIIGDRERFFNAVSDSEPLETKARVRVTQVNDDNTLTVTRA